MSRGEATPEEIKSWRQAERLSLKESYEQADMEQDARWEEELEERILTKKFLWALEDGEDYRQALRIFGKRGISASMLDLLRTDREESTFSLQIRLD